MRKGGPIPATTATEEGVTVIKQLDHRSVNLAALMTACLLAGSLLHAGDCTLVDDGVALKLENDFFRLTLRPPKGGTSLDFFYKPTGKQLIPKTEALPLFADTATEVGWRGPWVGTAYEYKVLAKTPQRASVHLWGKGSGAFPFVNMHKTITIYHDRCYVEVDHAVEVDVNNMVPAYISPWFHNGLAVVGEQTQYVAPVPSGLRRSWDVECQSKSIDHKDITRPWSAMIGKSGTGLGLELTNYKNLEKVFHAFYQQEWCFEWRYHRVKIRNGDRLESKFWLIPFHGVSGVDGVGGRMAGFLKCPEKLEKAGKVEASLELCAGERSSGNVAVTAALLPDGAPETLLQKVVSLETSKVQTFPFAFPGAQEGTYVLRCTMSSGDQVICDFEKPVTVGKPSGTYAMQPWGERLEPEAMDREPMKLSHEVVTPHVKWAKPYAGGKVRALILCDILGVRDIVEVAQRMDLDYTTVKMSNGDSYLRYYGAPDTYGPPTILECNDCLRTALKSDYDVVLISGLNWNRFTGDNRKKILELARKGTGFIYIGPPAITKELSEVLGVYGRIGRPRFERPVPGEPHFLNRSLPYGALFRCPAYPLELDEDAEPEVLIETQGGTPLLVARDADCRSIALLYRPGGLLPRWHGAYENTWPEYDYGVRYDYWEYYYGLVIRSLLWAARKEPDIRFGEIEAPGDPVEVEALKDRTVSVSVEKTSDGAGQYELEFAFRNEDYRLERTVRKKAPLSKGQKSIAVPLPTALANGLQLVDIRLLDAKRNVVNWTSTSFHVRTPVRIRSCHLDKRIYSTDDTVEAKVVLEGRPQGLLRGEAEVADRHGRVVWHGGGRLSSGSAAFGNQIRLLYKFGIEPLANWHRFEFRLVDQTGVIQRMSREFLVFPRQTERREWDDYVMGRTHRSTLIPQYWLLDRYNAQLASLGFHKADIWEHAFGLKAHDLEALFDLFQGGAERLAVILGTGFGGGHREDLKKIEASKRAFKETGDKRKLVRAPCLDDPEFWRREKGNLTRALKSLTRVQVESYHLADEDTLTRFGNHGDCCYGPLTLRTFRAWLRAEYYPTLKDLNTEWDTRFKTWEEVVPMTREEVRNRGNYAPWADHRSYMETAWARAWKHYGEIIHERAPYSFIGSGGSQIYGADNGLDYWKFYREWTQGNVRNVIWWLGKMYRSFPGAPIMTPSTGLSWNTRGGQCRYRVWKVAFEGCGGGDSAYPSITKVAPDLSISESGRDAEEVTRPLRRGVGKLLRKLDIAWDNVAIHYSQPSIHGEFIIGHDHVSTKSHHAWVWVLRDLGIDPRYVSYAQVEDGELVAGGYKVFIMPFSVAVSQKESQQIETFVQQGGVVIGDAMTGIMDGHCKPRNPSPMDQLFGLKRERQPEGQSGKVLVPPRGPFDAMKRGTLLSSSFIEGGLTPVKAEAIARFGTGESGLLINSHGKGKAIRLGFLLSDYPSVLRYDAKQRNQVLSVTRGLLGLAGVSRKVEVTGAGGESLPFSETWRFRRGNAEYVGVLREWDDRAELKEEPVTVQFPEPRHVYEILGGKYHGKTDRAQARLAPGAPLFFALLNEKVSGVEVTTSPTVIQQSGRSPALSLDYEIAVSPGSGAPEDHALRVEVVGPDGKPRDFYAANVFAIRGKARGALQFALNDPRGTWQIAARDVVSGLTGKAAISVK